MKTLEEYNERKNERMEIHKLISERKNGIACPTCGEELIDTTPNVLLTSNPPQKNIECMNCGYIGYRLA